MYLAFCSTYADECLEKEVSQSGKVWYFDRNPVCERLGTKCAGGGHIWFWIRHILEGLVVDLRLGLDGCKSVKRRNGKCKCAVWGTGFVEAGGVEAWEGNWDFSRWGSCWLCRGREWTPDEYKTTTTTTTTTTASQPLFPSLIHLSSTSPNLRFNRRILLLITYQHPHPSITRVDHAHPIISTTPPILLSRLATKPTFETLLYLPICLALSPLWGWRYFSDCGWSEKKKEYRAE